jgi:hypothetical protein
LGDGALILVPGLGCLAQLSEAYPGRLSARFSLGNFVFFICFRDGRYWAGVDP